MSEMRITEIFGLQKTQYELDFVDIDTEGDTPLFIDSYFLAMREDPWSIDASRTIRSFFSSRLRSYRRETSITRGSCLGA